MGQGGGIRGPIQNAARFYPKNIAGSCLDRRFGKPCSKYLSLMIGGVDLSDYTGQVAVPPGGPSDFVGTFREGFMLGSAAGRVVNKYWRVEWDSSWRNNSGDIWSNDVLNINEAFDGHFNVYSTTFNAIRDFSDCKLFSRTPCGLYAGGGIGFSKQDGDFDVNGNLFELQDWAFAYQAFVGLDFWETRRGKLFVEYRYLANTATELTANGAYFDDFIYESQNILFGIRITK